MPIDKEMEGKVADPSHWEYRTQPRIINFDHAIWNLLPSSESPGVSWMPNARFISPS